MQSVLDTIREWIFGYEPVFMQDGSINVNNRYVQRALSIQPPQQNGIGYQQIPSGIVTSTSNDNNNIKAPPIVVVESMALPQSEKLKARIESLEKDVENYKTKARNALEKGNKKEALAFLNKKKEVQETIDLNKTQLDNLTCMESKLHSIELDKLVFDTQKEGGESLKLLVNQTNVEKITAVKTDIDEMSSLVNGISFSVSKSISTIDIDGLENELADLEDEIVKDRLNSNSDDIFTMNTIQIPKSTPYQPSTPIVKLPNIYGSSTTTTTTTNTTTTTATSLSESPPQEKVLLRV